MMAVSRRISLVLCMASIALQEWVCQSFLLPQKSGCSSSCLARRKAFQQEEQEPDKESTSSSSSSLWRSLAADNVAPQGRRQSLQALSQLAGGVVASSLPPAALFLPRPAKAFTVTGANDGNLPDLPPEAVRSYLQYRAPLQTSADFYVFELQELLRDTNEWGLVGDFFRASTSRGQQGSPNRIEREFSNVMRILGLSMPPEAADDLQTAQYKFERAMATVSKATEGVRRDLPVEIDPKAPVEALRGWEDGRQALNSFFTIVNGVTGLGNELRTIPAMGPNQFQEYGRSERRYVDLKKKIRLCQNRGGPTLSQAWGGLMVSGYLQDSCGIPDLDAYFYQ